MSSRSQRKAVSDYRTRLSARGLARFEVVGRPDDRDLLRSLAKRLAGDDAEARRIRETVRETIGGEPPGKGGILAALRRSPLVGAEALDIGREATAGRKVEL